MPPHHRGTHKALLGGSSPQEPACGTASVPASPSLAGVMARHGRDGQLLPVGCSAPPLPAAVPLRPGRQGQGPVPRVLTQQDERRWWDHPSGEHDKEPEQHQGT